MSDRPPMKTLLLLRHGKSSWKHDVPDHDRPLKKRGRRDAKRMGLLVRQEGLLPDYVWSSTATRTRQTAERFIAAAELDVEAELTRALYRADPDAICSVIAGTPEAAGIVLSVGHNPGTAEAIEALVGRSERVPTCTLAALELPIARWSDLHPGVRGTLRGLWRPKELTD